MTNSEPGLGEQAISKVAELGITSQLDEVEELNIDIRTDPLKVIQGEVDSVTIAGKGMVIQQDLRMESLEIITDSVSIDPLSVVFGNVELTQSTNAEATICLTEADLNRALGSEFLRPRLKNLSMQMEGKPIVVDIQYARLKLPGDGKLAIKADLLIQETGETQQFSAIVVPKLKENEQKISLEILSTEGRGLTPELSAAILERIMVLLDIRNFEIPGMTLQLKSFKVHPGKLTLYATTRIDQIPSA